LCIPLQDENKPINKEKSQISQTLSDSSVSGFITEKKFKEKAGTIFWLNCPVCLFYSLVGRAIGGTQTDEVGQQPHLDNGLL
jgi:hypothetical protein